MTMATLDGSSTTTLISMTGLALNPATPLNTLDAVLGELDLVLLMSVNPGFGGQKFIEKTYDKIKRLKEMIIASGSDAVIEIDGGASIDNAQQLIDAGADVLVAGSAVFKADNPTEMISRMKNL